jgi:hypothetical protein
MKKLLLSLLILSSSYSYSQSYFGVTADFNLSTLTSGNGIANAGYSAGIFYDTPISEHFHFYPSLVFTQNRSASKEKKKPEYYLQSYSIETPLLISYRLHEEMFSLALDLGPYFRYGLGGKSWTRNEENEKEHYNTFKKNKKFDYGAQVGIGAIMNHTIHLHFYVQHGFIKPNKELRGNNLTYNITFGYAFEL